jgi:hypothetical protein
MHLVEGQEKGATLEVLHYGCPGIFLRTDLCCEYGEAFEEREAST